MFGAMGKLLFAAVLACSSLGSMAQQPTITISPTPPSVGDILRVKHTGPYPVTLSLDWYPSGSPTSVTITSDKGATVTVPTADSLIVSDPTPGGAAPVSTMIQ